MNLYFDYNATSPLFPHARTALLEACDRHWQNPSSLYPSAHEVKGLIEECREAIAQTLGVGNPERIVFTSGATEANNLVLAHCGAANPSRRILVGAVEHPSVWEPARHHFPEWIEAIPVDKNGAADLDALKESLERNSSVSLVTLMAANNETGVKQPWQDAGALCREKGVPFHCDATQWIGKLPADSLGECDWLSGSAHKFGGPKGVGFLVVPEGLRHLSSSQRGGPQENRLRAGTENYPAIAAMQAALARANSLISNQEILARSRDGFEKRIQESIPELRICGSEAPRLWNTSLFVLPQHRNLKWITRLNDLGVHLSTGSACSSGKGNPSHVMEAMGLGYDEMGRVLRVSSGWETSPEDWTALAEALEEVHASLESRSRRKDRANTISLSNLGSAE